MSDTRAVRWSIEQGIGRLVFDRPGKSNALGVGVVRDLVAAIDALLVANPKVIVLQATGRVFCAGGDITEFLAAGCALDRLVDDILDALHPAFLRLVTGPAPLISQVSGPIGGAGVGLALCADFVLAAESMKLRTGYAAIGLSPDVGSSWFLARRAGTARAQQLFLLSDPVGAQQCADWGIVDEVHPDAALPGAVQRLAGRLAAAPRGSMAAIRQLCGAADRQALQAHLAREHHLLRECARGADAREGVAAFKAGCTPRFGD